MLEKKGNFNVERVVQEFDEVTRDASKVQRETLRKILEENGDTEYLQGLGLGGRTDIESFRACVPLVTHHDLEPYIQRIVDGDTAPILTGKPVTSISLRYKRTSYRTFTIIHGLEKCQIVCMHQQNN